MSFLCCSRYIANIKLDIFTTVRKKQENSASGNQRLSILIVATDDTAKRSLTIFWELFTVIPCAPKDFER